MNSKKNLKRNLLICLLAGSAVMYTLPLHAATSVIANTTLPGNILHQIGGVTTERDNVNHVLDVTQSNSNAFIKWDSFDVGGSAIVNFKGPQVEGGYNTLNYVNAGGSMSQIYGTINANNNGNIFIVNPAGVQIGNSAQINVGSLYVSNKYLNEDKLGAFAGTITPEMINATKTADAALMSLGNINASKVTFEGDGRIVIDSERLKDVAGTEKLTADKIFVNTKDKNNVVIGYDAYKNGSYANVNNSQELVTLNGSEKLTKAAGYMWVEDVEQLQAINTNLGGNYALRNSIDATSTATAGNSFISIGSDNNAFIGKFDGIDYNIFGLTIDNNNKSNTGLFGETNGATINNVTLVGGKITGGNNTGALVGHAINSTITNVVNSAEVNGDINVGGFIGASTNSIVENAVNTGSVHSDGGDDNKGGTVSNAGGLIGYMYNGTLDGNSYNLGDVSGDGYNVGGLVGRAVTSTIGDGTNLVYNRMDVTGAYNVGGIVGNMEGSTVQNAENSGMVLAEKYKTEYYTYHTGNQTYDDYYGTRDDGISGVEVNVANVGGIVGTSSASNNGKASKIENVTNTANVSSDTDTYNQYGSENEYYIAGNVAGIVGRAEDTDISNATNQENEIRGAHNVGGVAGYFGTSDDNSDNKYTVTNGINDGGDIMATGARAKQGVNNSNLVNDKGFALEQVRSVSGGSETVIIGNMGGVVGYLEGDNVYVTGSANRGIVHSQEITNPNQVLYTSQAANTGGVVGKLDTDRNSDLSDEEKLKGLQGKTITAAVSDSYNTGNISGYTGVGGIIGMMYNGEVANSYNIGAINTTRRPVSDANGDTVNMGGVVGDTTEEAGASAVIYNVYNEGQIGDDEYNYYARHIGGVVGRLSGIVDKAYNTGDIYSGYSVVGGIVGWLYEGTVSNAFNTGNITTVNNDRQNNGSQVGGIAGAVAGYNTYDANVSNRLYNAYNLGTIRSFTGESDYIDMGGIVGKIVAGANNHATVNIENVYTTANLYTNSNNTGSDGTYGAYRDIGSIYGQNSIGTGLTVNNANYVQFKNYNNFNNLTNTNNNGRNGEKINIVSYKDRYSHGAYDLVNIDTDNTWSEISGGSVGKGDWRYYDGKTMPILNAFLPNAEDYFSGETGHTNTMNGIDSIQYGTAYNPLLTIINAKVNTDNLTFDWGDLGITGAASIAVYNSGLTLYNVDTSDGTGYYGGLLYSDGDLSLNTSNKDGEAEDGVSGNISLGSGAKLYGSSVDINADGTVTIYGSVTASGNKGESNIKITAGDVNVYGTMVSVAEGGKTSISGIADSATADNFNFGNITDRYQSATSIGNRYGESVESQGTGSITINSGTKTVVNNDGSTSTIAIGDGNVNLYFGNKEQGFITTGGDLTVTGTGDVYVDSDLDIAGNMTLTSTGKDGEVLLTLTNIGKVQADRFTEVIEKAINGIEVTEANKNKLIDVINSAVGKEFPDLGFSDDPQKAEAIVTTLLKGNNKVEAIDTLNNDVAIEYMHDFMHSFERSNNQDTPDITLSSASGNSKLTVDMWEDNDNGTGQFNFEKYDSNSIYTSDEHTFVEELNNLNLTINDNSNIDAADVVYVEVHNGEQLKGIQSAGNDALGYNYALMGDINASDVTDYEAIGTNSANGFTGTFDGRGNRIIGLKVSGDNAGIFSEIGTRTENINGEIVTHTGTVKNVNIYSGNFTGGNSAGAVAGVNSGRIENVTGFGNTVTVTGDANNAGNAGGIVGVNNGKSDFETSDGGASTLTGNGIYDVQNVGSVIAGGNKVVAGGLVGTNNGALGNSYSDSAVTSTAGTSAGLGGVAGVNTQNGDVQYVDSLGVTNGGTTGSSNVGGIIGVNNGNMYSGYNESIVSGRDNVGGIIGVNTSTVSNIVNATGINGTDYVGGLVGDNDGNVSSGRNNGTITGNNYVGGMVGSNGANSILKNLVNAESADIVGENYVGGIAGTNSGEITADDQSTLENLGSITGQNYVGGVAGENIGRIEYIETNISLNVKDPNQNAQYFGGVAGINGRVDDNPIDGVDNDKTGTITSATNKGNVIAADADYVGGIVGLNTANGQLLNSSNAGRVEGANYVGGVAGKNEASITGKANDLLTIDNSGVVIAHKGGAGGIFGENTGNIEYAELTNNGIVSGTYNADKVAGTGGLIGVNSGEIKHSSLKNNIGGQVIGTQNVGGLIGVNTGNIEGGRNEQEVDKDGKETVAADSYYKYQIYNNGVINVGTWKDDVDSSAEGYGKVEADEFTSQAGTNIGGLIGYNTTETINGVKQTGSLTAGYNTGAINAGGSTNVGGIVGNNEGIVDQVFNTVYNTDGTKGAVTGGTNVGGLVGNNSGTLSNAYNTTGVKGAEGSTGNAVGVNTNKVENIYGYSELVGTGDKATNSYVIDDSDKWKQQGNYKGFDFAGSDTKSPVWKIYEGNSNPLLKVFLTDVEIKVDVDKINEYINKVYNGNAQAITDDDIDKLIAEGAIEAQDDFIAYNNAKELINSISHTNAGKYSDWLYSQQIASSGSGDTFNPNNLGYDIALTGDINKAKLTINLGNVTHTYGTPNTDGYTYTVEGWINDEDANDYTISIGALGNGITDNALKDNNAHTKDVGEYTWSTTANISANGGTLDNYEIVTVNSGKSTVVQVTVNVTLNGVTHIYGDSFNSNDYTVGNVNWVNGDNYSTADVVLSNINDGAFTNGNGGKTNDVTADGYKWDATVSGNGANADTINKNYVFNVIDGDSKVTPKEVTIEDILASIEYGSKGDFTVENTGNISGTVYDDNLGISYTDTSVIAGSEYALNQNGRDTADVKVNNGVYTDSISINGIKLTGDKAGNYYISSDTAKGDIRVDKAQIQIGANNDAIHVGGVPDYTGTDINGELVNGDKLNGNYHYGVEDSANEKVVGDHSIGVWIGNMFYDLSATVDWTEVDGFFSNYEVTYNPGTLTVTEQVMPDLPDNWPNNRWDYLFGDNPFDRNENFRERKAEVNFVDGAMEI